MIDQQSKLAESRSEGRHQIEYQRASILAASERLFLHAGLENTKMVDIAEEAGITKITLYRYFTNRGDIAAEVHKRMLNKISFIVTPEVSNSFTQAARELAHSMVVNFAALKEPYRFMYMFDHLYPHHPSVTSLVEWARLQVQPLSSKSNIAVNAPDLSVRIAMIFNSVVCFLETTAFQEEPSSQGALQFFDEMIMSYFDQLE
jgi:AcrR family transcriptional regulator